jgi:uncharacterized membrane protein SpoIIM required for sporulation
MNSWEHLRLKREQLRLFFWAARQTVFLLVLVVLTVAMGIEVVVNGNTPTLDPLIRLVGQ